MSNYRDFIHERQVNEFNVRVYAHYDDLFGVDDLEDDEYKKELQTKLDSGELIAFTSEVVVTKCNIELGRSFLSGHIYADPKDYIKDNDYLVQQIDEAIEKAKNNLKRLQA